MRVRHVMITAAIAGLFAACASSGGDGGKTEPVHGTVCEARCACEGCSDDQEGLCEAEQGAIAERSEERCQDEYTAYIDCVRLEGRCVDGHHLAEACDVHEEALLECLDSTDRCPSAGDGICDEPQGTGKCPAGTDRADCLSSCPSTGDGTCDEPEGTGLCAEGTDVVDCAATTCSRTNNGTCDEPEGTGLCAEGTDVADCAVDEPCATTDNGECDEPGGTGLCEAGTDTADCSAPLTCDDLDECGDDSKGCIGCANAGSCADELDTCILDDDCIGFTRCVVTCADDDDACFRACMDAHPDGRNLYANYDRCVNCNECYYSCGNASIFGCNP